MISIHCNRYPPPSLPHAHVSSLAQYHDLYQKSIVDPKVLLPHSHTHAASCSSVS